MMQREEHVSFSIVICCYNARPLMERGVGSAIATTGRETELILVDNHSPYPEVREYLPTLTVNPRVRLFDPGENLGPFRGSHYGIVRTRGEYVVMLNDDMVVPPGWHQAMARALAEHPSLAYLALPWTPEQVSEGVGPGQKILEGEGYRVKISLNGVLFGCIMIERRVWQEHLVYDQPGFYSGDQELFYARKASELGKISGYLISHPGLHLARAPETDPLYGMWKVLCASGHSGTLQGDFASWRERLQRPEERRLLVDERAKELLLSFGYPAEDLADYLEM